MWFLEKREILEYCGKNGKDVRWLDRAMRKWIVIHDIERGYITTVDYIDELREGLKGLNKSESKTEVVVPEVKVSSNSEEVKLLRNHLSYVWQRNEHRRACIEKMVQAFFEKNRQKYDFESAMAAFYKVIWFIEDSDENEEREWAISEWLLPF